MTKEVTIAVMGPTETKDHKAFLDPKWTQINEINELYCLRTISITHQLTDDQNTDLTKYDTILIAGNKIWKKTSDGDDCLYVLRGPKVYDFDNMTVTITGVEAAVELGEYGLTRGNGTWSVSTFLNTWTNLFVKGNVSGSGTAKYNGTYTVLGSLQELQTQTGIEFQFRYVYDNVNDVIKRYVDLMPMVGKEHLTPIEIGYNAENIELSIDESDVRIAAGPIGQPDDANSTFHKARITFENKAIAKGESIPLYYTKDDSGSLVAGPNAAAPYAKTAGSKFVVCDTSSELIASYQKIQQQEGGAYQWPRVWTFESSEENEINLYWECVNHIHEHLNPQVDISCNVVDLKKLQGAVSEYYNIGDIVYIRIPNRSDVVQCRITKTSKNPREPESVDIEISTYKTNFLRNFFKSTFKSPGSIVIS